MRLVYWSSFYDDIYNHPERPDEDTIKNDKLLDAWVDRANKDAEADREEYLSNSKKDRGTSKKGKVGKEMKKQDFFHFRKPPHGTKLPKKRPRKR